MCGTTGWGTREEVRDALGGSDGGIVDGDGALRRAVLRLGIH